MIFEELKMHARIYLMLGEMIDVSRMDIITILPLQIESMTNLFALKVPKSPDALL